jgi:hypothetical protein
MGSIIERTHSIVGDIDLYYGTELIGKLHVIKHFDTHKWQMMLEFKDTISKKGYQILGKEKLKAKIEKRVANWDCSPMQLVKVGAKSFKVV